MTPADLAQFNALTRQAASLLDEAAKLHGLPSLLMTQARAAHAFSVLTLHTFNGEANSGDFKSMIADCEQIARRTDDLIEAIGNEAKYHDRQIDAALFRNQLRDALDGNAFFDLNEAADRADAALYADDRDDFAEHNTLNLAHQGV